MSESLDECVVVDCRLPTTTILSEENRGEKREAERERASAWCFYGSVAVGWAKGGGVEGKAHRNGEIIIQCFKLCRLQCATKGGARVDNTRRKRKKSLTGRK